MTIEVEVRSSRSRSRSAQKKFAGSNGDPTFVEVMGLSARATWCPAAVGRLLPRFGDQ